MKLFCALILALGLLAGCNGVDSSGSGPATAADTSPPPTTDPTPSSTLSITGQPPTSVIAGSAYVFTPGVVAAPAATLTFNITNKPAWASFNTSTGLLSGTPQAGDVGTDSGIVISVGDGTTTASLPAFAITVSSAAAPQPPTISGTPTATVAAGSSYSFTPDTTDPAGAGLSFSITNKPAWAAFDTGSGALTGTPQASNVGSYAGIVISVTDGTNTAALPAFSITVSAAPKVPAPTISGTPATNVTAGSAYSFTPATTHPSGSALTFTIKNQPGWAMFNASTGQLSGTPQAANVGTYAGIVISVTDGSASASLPTFSITVSTVPGPKITGSPATTVTAGASYSFTPGTTNPSGKSLSFAIQGRPTWATFSTTTGALTGTPRSANVGTYTGIVISVTDGTSSAALAAFSIRVLAAAAPTIGGTPAASVIEGNTYNFTPTTTDPSGGLLTFSIQNKPSWANFNTSTGTLSGTPQPANIGSYPSIVISVSDGTNSAALASFSIRVDAGAAPTISGTPATSVTAGSAYSFTPSTTDPSGKTLTFAIGNKPSWASFNTATGALTGTPASSNAGTYSGIAISVTDGMSSASLATFSITVSASAATPPPPPPPSPPTISGSPATSVVAGNAYSFTPSTTDPSGKTLTFSITNKPAWASFSTTTGALTGTPQAANVGSFSSITISVTDGTSSASLAAFSITVNAAAVVSSSNPPPAGAPLIAYTDILSGPNTGGENNNGVYLSLFGVNFGNDATKVSVTVGGGAVARVMYLGPSNGRPDIEQLSVQLGANAKTGAIVVTVGGVSSNTDQTFTVTTTGKLYFIDNVNGSDSNPGTFTAPFQSPAPIRDNAQPGDFMIMKGNSGTPYTTTAGYYWGVRVMGTAANPITLMGYPGQVPFINAGNVVKAGIYAYNGPQSAYINVVGIKLDAAGSEGAIDVEAGGNNWRVVNNDLSMLTAGAGGTPTNAGAIAGQGAAEFWVGNHIHDTYGTWANQTHGIYVNDGPGTYELAYNWVENVYNGSGIQLDGPEGSGLTSITAGAHIHHNIIHNTLKYGIELGDYANTAGYITDIVVWDNLVYNTGGPGLIFNTITSTAPLQAKIYNNTFYNVSTGGGSGAIDNDNGANLAGMAITFTNNIVVPHAGSPYFTELSGSSGLAQVAGTNNLWSGGTGSGFGSSSVTGTPSFVSPPAATAASGGALPNMRLNSGSAGIGAGATSVLSGNGIATMVNFPLFPGVLTDLTGKPVSASVNVGALQ